MVRDDNQQSSASRKVQTMNVKPIPAFYCCYLLRSTTQPTAAYIGSTPHPVRRLAQHNGLIKGGAWKTAGDSKRPWKIACLVAGFPSNIAALQFEWAWQHPHLSRHNTGPDTNAGTNAGTLRKGIGKSSSEGPGKPKRSRPRASLSKSIPDLHLLLRSEYFSKWPLEVRFFSIEAYQAWRAYCDRADSRLNLSIEVSFRPTSIDNVESRQVSEKDSSSKELTSSGVQNIDPTYKPLAKFVEKGQSLLVAGADPRCAICGGVINPAKDLLVLCSQFDCQSTSHIHCLSNEFLTRARNPDLVFPSTGKCPSCKSALQWAELMKELTLRNRGPKLVYDILKKTRNNKGGKSRRDADLDNEPATEDDDLTSVDLARLSGDLDDVESEMNSVTSLDSEPSISSKSGGRRTLPIVIEDSDLDG